MTQVTAPSHDPSSEPDERRLGFAWLQRDEGWARSEGAARLALAVVVAFGSVGLKLLVVRGFGGELGYLSYVGAVALGAWIAGLRGGLITTGICAIAEVALFTRLFLPSELISTSELFRVGLFLFDGVLVSVITSALRRATYRERLARDAGEASFAEKLAAHQAADDDRLALQRLQAVTGSLAGAATPEEVADAILDRGLTALEADAGVVTRLDSDGRGLSLMAGRGYPANETRRGRTYSLDGQSHLADAVRTAEPIFLGDPTVWMSRYPGSPPHPMPGSSGGGAIAVLPLVSAGRVLGTVVFRFAAERDFDDGTGALATRLAEQGAQALDRAIAYDNERRARQALERGQERLRFLAEASDRLGLRLEIGSGLDEVARLAVPGLADWCAIELLDLDRPVLATAAVDEAAVLAVGQLASAAPRSLGAWLIPEADELGATIVTVDSTSFAERADPRALGLLGTLKTATLVVAPILGEAGSAVGSIVLGSADPDRFDEDDLALARDLASRIGVAADQARLFGAVDRFKATVDVSGDAVYMFDPETLRLTYVNRGGAELMAVEPSTLLGTSVLDLQAEAGADEFRTRLAAIRTGRDKAVTFTGLLVHADRREIPVDAFLQMVTLPDGGTTAILSAHDVSERIAVQARLTRIASDERRQAAELLAVIQAMGEGILVAGHDGAISLANDAAAEILVDIPERLADLTERLGLDESARSGQPDADGRPLTVSLANGRWVEVATYPADLGGGLTNEAGPSNIIVLRDVTRARDAEATREAFLGVLSHELRTPVTTIFGYAKVLRRSALRKDRDAMLADIEIEADRLYRIVEDLLALSRVEDGMTIEGEPLLLQHIAGAVVGSEAQRWSEISFETELAPSLPPVFGERTYVEQVLRNMVANAGKYSPPETLVTVRAGATPTEVLVEVLDRGPGVQPDEAERLFDLYYRSPTTARTAAGAGIGLYVSRGLITAMGGRIWANARLGGGSVFGFSLPRCEEDQVGESNAPEQ